MQLFSRHCSSHVLFELIFVALAKKMAQSSESSKKKVKKAMEKGDMELAKIHAESSVRQKNTARNFERIGICLGVHCFHDNPELFSNKGGSCSSSSTTSSCC